MLDLTSGTLELDGTAFGPRTTLDQLRNSGLPIRAAGAPSALPSCRSSIFPAACPAWCCSGPPSSTPPA